MNVHLDGKAYTFHAGARVAHLIARLPAEWQVRIQNGLAAITDADGNELGDGGALRDGAQYHLKTWV